MAIYLKQFTKVSNAGDLASNYILSRLLDTDVEVVGEAPLDRPNLIAIGSILQWADACSTIWGAGLISAEAAPTTPPAGVIAVRGLLTRQRLMDMGMSVPDLVGDPGILISDFFTPPPQPRKGIGVVPHYADIDHPFVNRAIEQGAKWIDPQKPLENYLVELASCEVVVSSSLHGIVFAHSYGIPAVWVQMSNRVIGDGFKFRDYYSSIGIEAEDIPMLNGEHSLGKATDMATLPRNQIDREDLCQAVKSIALQLQDGFQW